MDQLFDTDSWSVPCRVRFFVYSGSFHVTLAGMSVVRYSSCKLPTLHGQFELIIYRSVRNEEIAVLLTDGFAPGGDVSPFVRIHSQCFTAEVMGSLKCDCREQLTFALQRIGAGGDHGMIIYLPQEGRGIGLGNKVRAYSLQEQGADTLEANHLLGFEGDLRDFQMAADILLDMGVKRVRLNTNNPDKIQALVQNGIVLDEIVPSIGNENPFNRGYLRTKAEKMGHIQLAGVPVRVLSCSEREE
jgi:3,4-dihydroxy 2-butanone 4-phosphate synthase / GTP cyclohydrolase II